MPDIEDGIKGKHREILVSTIGEIEGEGSLSSGKTITFLWKELQKTRQYPGIWIFIARWTDDATRTLLRPVFEQLARIARIDMRWNRDENAYEFGNGSRVFAFGLKTQSQLPEERYGKIRGLAVSRIFIDQAEQVPEDIAEELRARLRPDIEAKVAGRSYPTQLSFAANPVPKEHWLARQFPEEQSVEGRHYWPLSLDDNAHNLPPEQIANLKRTYHPKHPKFRTVILGLRGRNPLGVPVYVSAFQKKLHIVKTDINPHVPLLEVIDAGKENPAVLWSQFDQWGRWLWLGGMMGVRMDLGEFCDILSTQRMQWFGMPPNLLQASNPFGMHATTNSALTAIEVLRQHKIFPRFIENSNQPIIRKAAIERTADYMKKRTANGEAFQCDPDRWIVIQGTESREDPFGPDALEDGYVWSKVLRRSANKSLTVPVEDGWFEHVMTCAEMTELNFGRGHTSPDKIERQAARAEAKALREAQRDKNEPFRWNRNTSRNRAGYR